MVSGGRGLVDHEFDGPPTPVPGDHILFEYGIINISYTVADVDAADYPAYVAGLPERAYHIYDYQFFFGNLKENVRKRVESYLSTNSSSK